MTQQTVGGGRDQDGPGDLVVYPTESVERYRRLGVWRDRTIAQELRDTAEHFPGRIALVGPDAVLSYAELDRRTDRIAVGLRELGIRTGDRVLLQLGNRADTILAWYGLLKAGAVPVATLALHRRHEIVSIARQCAPVAHIIDTAFTGHDLRALAQKVRREQPSLRLLITVGSDAAQPGEIALSGLQEVEVAPEVAREAVADIQSGISSDDIAALQLSGGTTSVPKLIPRLHAEYWYNSRAWAYAMGIDHQSCAVHLLPVVHNAGIVCAVHAAHAVGACVATSGLDPGQLKAVARAQPITHMLMTRPIAQAIGSDSELRAMLDSLRVVVWADRAVPESVVAEFDSDRCRVTQMFGMGEGLCMIAPLDAPADVRHQTQGAPISPHDEVRVLEPGTEHPVAVGERGELCARGPYTIPGYYRAAERNAVAFTSDGFYRTGDIVSEVRHGGSSFYRLEDRIKDLINRGGEKINAEEVELVLLRHPAVERAAVVAMPDERLGERSCAFVVARAGMEPPGLEAVKEFFYEQGVAKYKWPERIEHTDELPLSNIHKVNKVELRRMISEILESEKSERQL